MGEYSLRVAYEMAAREKYSKKQRNFPEVSNLIKKETFLWLFSLSKNEENYSREIRHIVNV